ncbi:MAG: leucine-rich repeat protein, partial [Christensenellales bacterium]
SFNFANTPLVIEIEEQLFYECNSLTDVNFGSVKVINNQAFQSCTSLIKVELPDTIDAIGNYAFSACNTLAAVIIYDASPSGISIGASEPFGSATTILKIYVPDGSEEAFKADASFVLYKELIFNVNVYVAP